VQACALAGGWLVAAFVAGGGTLTPAAFVGLVHAGSVALPAPVVGLLASGGSAFWTQVLQLASSVKDAAATRSRAEALALDAQAETLGVPTLRDGESGPEQPVRRTRLRMQLQARPPERLDAPAETV
jgi:hypothetical protein